MPLSNLILYVMLFLVFTSIILTKIIFLSFVFYKYRIKAVLVYIIFLFLSSYPLNALTTFLNDWKFEIIRQIETDRAMLWLGNTVNYRMLNFMYLEKLVYSTVDIIEVFLFIWLIKSLLKLRQ